MTDNQQRLAEIVAHSYHNPQVHIRLVRGGYIVTGAAHYTDKVTGGVLASANYEVVGQTPEEVRDLTYMFLTRGSFDPEASIPLFEAEPSPVPVPPVNNGGQVVI